MIIVYVGLLVFIIYVIYQCKLYKNFIKYVDNNKNLLVVGKDYVIKFLNSEEMNPFTPREYCRITDMKKNIDGVLYVKYDMYLSNGVKYRGHMSKSIYEFFKKYEVI